MKVVSEGQAKSKNCFLDHAELKLTRSNGAYCGTPNAINNPINQPFVDQGKHNPITGGLANNKPLWWMVYDVLLSGRNHIAVSVADTLW